MTLTKARLQNDGEETEAREKKGSRPGVLRFGYCVKQGNVVRTQLLGTRDLPVCYPHEQNGAVVSVPEEKLEEAFFHPGRPRRELLQVRDGEETTFVSDCVCLCLRPSQWGFCASQDKEPLRAIPLREVQKVHECLVKSG